MVDFDLDDLVLPDEDEATGTAVVKIVDKFDAKEAKNLIAGNAGRPRKAYYYDRCQVGDEKRMGFYGEWAPTVVAGLNRYHGLKLHYLEERVEEYTYSRLAHLLCTLDRSIMFSYENRHIAASKIRNLNACANWLLQPEMGVDYQELKEVIEEKTTSKDLIFQVKRNALSLARRVNLGTHTHILKKQEPHNLAYVGRLREMFGLNLSAVLLYGSSATGEGNDFDNIVVLKKVPDNLYQMIAGQGPNFREGEKDVGFIFISEDIAEQFFYMNVSNHLFLNSSKVLFGEIEFPIEDKTYMIRKERYHAGFGSTKNISGANLGFKDEALMNYIFYNELGIATPMPPKSRARKYILAQSDKQGLFDYFMKLPRFTLQGLLFDGQKEALDKTRLLEVLKERFGYEIFPHVPDKDYVADCMIKAMEVSAKIIREIYVPGEIVRPGFD